jgi:hypothetical protein
MKSTPIWAVLIGAAATAQAAKLPLYDNFGSGELDRVKWNETEAWRGVEDGRARLGRWVFGGNAGDTGVLLENWNLAVAGGSAPKGFQAKVTVTDISVDEQCAANPAASWPRARIIASYFNVRPGGPLPNDRTGDILAQIVVGRTSTSADPEGVLRVEGSLVECTVADCNSNTIVRQSVPLGTVMLGSPVVVRMDWSKSGNVFRFSRDGGTPVDAPYVDADGTSSSLPFANMAVRNQVPNCLSGPRVKAGLAAQFDDVRYSQ